MIKKKVEWIICFGSKWESPSVYTEKHIINYLYLKKIKILWVNPIPIRKINVKNFSKNTSIIKKIFSRIKSHIKIINKIKNGFYQLNPIFIPNVENESTRFKNITLLKFQLNILKKLLGIKKFGIISSGLTNIPKIFPDSKYIFFIQISGDLYSDLRNIDLKLKKTIKEDEFNIFNNADKILAASNLIFEKINRVLIDNKNLIYFPHGVDFNHFQVNNNSKLLNYPKPIAGYFGSLTDANDQSIYLALANSGFSVVLIGKITGDYSECKHKNIHFLGPISYKDLPLYANEFDISIMAWKPADWIKNCNPSKTLEYFALGKPIISNTIPELKNRYSDLIYFADEPDLFIKKAKQALLEDNDTLIERRKSIALKEDWNKKISFIFNDIF